MPGTCFIIPVCLRLTPAAAQSRPRAVRPDGDRIALPGRHPLLPELYRLREPVHPQLDGIVGVTDVIVALQDSSPKAMKEYWKFCKSQIFPDGTASALREAAGFIIAGPGVYIFSRDMWGDGDAMKDELQICVVPQDMLPERLARRMHVVSKDLIGPIAQCSSSKARKVGGVWEGGIRWERSDRAKNIKKADRCYTLGLLSMGRQACAALGVYALGHLPRRLTLPLERQAEAINLPRIGHIQNYAFPNMQLNVSATKRRDDCPIDAFKVDLGAFAGKHIDRKDSPGAITCMVTSNHLSKGVHPGYFLIGELGVAVEQEGLVITCFSGLRHHGGFPPIAPLNVPLHPSSTRIAGVILTGAATWFNEGAWLSPPDAYLQWWYQTWCQQIGFFARQVPPSVQLQVDYRMLSRCFSVMDRGRRVEAAPWDFHPGSTLRSTRLECTRAETVDLWQEHKDRQSKFIPLLNKRKRG
ncbi:hypothetical protein C8Q76DRAFT_609997 [Earliella scabrosa]|nr:hypothetical protein C8Q76DRAFT_611075 [Earliella scabrosa]KAI0735743.1 hypothetical protein C8Q76DRAFT_609997 [Earliella scabrosa]